MINKFESTFISGTYDYRLVVINTLISNVMYIPEDRVVNKRWIVASSQNERGKMPNSKLDTTISSFILRFEKALELYRSTLVKCGDECFTKPTCITSIIQMTKRHFK